MTDTDRSLCDCPEPCACYTEGYAAGEGKALLRERDGLSGRYPRRWLRLPALPGRAGLPTEGDDPDGQEIARSLQPGASLGIG